MINLIFCSTAQYQECQKIHFVNRKWEGSEYDGDVLAAQATRAPCLSESLEGTHSVQRGRGQCFDVCLASLKFQRLGNKGIRACLALTLPGLFFGTLTSALATDSNPSRDSAIPSGCTDSDLSSLFQLIPGVEKKSTLALFLGMTPSFPPLAYNHFLLIFKANCAVRRVTPSHVRFPFPSERPCVRHFLGWSTSITSDKAQGVILLINIWPNYGCVTV